MARRILWDSQAVEDLEGIWAYIALDDVEAADRFVDKIQERCQKLKDLPELGRSRPELAPGVRSLVIGNHVLYYKIAAEIQVVRVLHAARDVMRLF